MIELRQQVDTLRREPLNTDRAYRDGKAVALVGRFDNAPVHLFRRMAASEAARLLDDINEAREAQGLFTACSRVLQPASTKRVQELRKRLEKG